MKLKVQTWLEKQKNSQMSTKAFFYFLEGVLRNLKWRGLLTDLQQELKELLAGFL